MAEPRIFTYCSREYRVRTLEPIAGLFQIVVDARVKKSELWPREKPGSENMGGDIEPRFSKKAKYRVRPAHWRRMKTGSMQYDKVLRHLELIDRKKFREDSAGKHVLVEPS